jgi:type I restriction enzyme, S subunit
MKGGWKTVSVGEVAKVNTGNSAPQDKELFSAGTHPFVRTSDVGKIRIGSIGNSADKLNEKGIKKLRLFSEGTILFPKSGASTFLNHRVILARDTYVSSHLATIKADNSHALDRYLLHYLTTIKAQDLIQDHKYPSLKISDIQGIEIPLPLLPEQKRIVAILDEAFEGIDRAVANAEKNLANARELFESYLNKVFTKKGDGWVETTLGDVAEVKGGKRLPKGYKPQLDQTKYPYIRVADFDNKGSVSLNDMRYISEDIHSKIKRYTISSDDVFITIVGATIGKSGIVPEELNGANLTENACKLVLKKNLSNKYVYYFTCTNSFYEQVGLNTRTSAQPKLALVRLKQIRLAIPPFNIQQSLAEECDKLSDDTEHLESIYQRKLTCLAELKQSLLQKAFSGELTANDTAINEEAVA